MLDVGTAVPLFKARTAESRAGVRQQYDVTRDGQRFLLNVPLEEAADTPITIVVNWTAALKK